MEGEKFWYSSLLGGCLGLSQVTKEDGGGADWKDARAVRSDWPPGRHPGFLSRLKMPDYLFSQPLFLGPRDPPPPGGGPGSWLDGSGPDPSPHPGLNKNPRGIPDRSPGHPKPRRSPASDVAPAPNPPAASTPTAFQWNVPAGVPSRCVRCFPPFWETSD